MTHELKNIVERYIKTNSLGYSCVLVTVVALNGSSYRKPGVRMLIDSNGQITGAVSGGCVEKEIIRQAQKVFEQGIPIMMTYDGRYRIGCEGLLYILIEPFDPGYEFLTAFNFTIENRLNIELHSYYNLETGSFKDIGTEFILNETPYSVSNIELNKNQPCFQQTLPPCFRLYIVGVEHDAQHLCAQAALLGWEVFILKSLDQFHGLKEFPGAAIVQAIEPNNLKEFPIDEYSAFVLMSHNFAKDLNYLLQLSNLFTPLYIGVLGSNKRMEQLFSNLLEHTEDISEIFMDSVHGPAGIDIKAITPQEISISILSQIIENLRAVPKLIPVKPKMQVNER